MENSNKTVTIVAVSQKEVTKFPMCTVEKLSFEKLCKTDKDFQNSSALRTLYSNDEVKEIVIVLYEVLNQEGMRRRIAGSNEVLGIEGRKKIVKTVCDDLKIDIDFYKFGLESPVEVMANNLGKGLKIFEQFGTGKTTIH